MCNKFENISPLRCIIPPYMADKLMNSDDREIADQAVNSQLQASMLRTSRQFISGLELGQRNSLIAEKNDKAEIVTLSMQVYDIQHSTDTANGILLWENDKIIERLDQDAKNVVLAGKGTWDFYYSIFGRNSIDNLGLTLKHYIHYGNTADDMNNAMWDGIEMVYGDGDGKIFGSFTSDPDIIGHELTHGVTQYESNLAYHNQSGALNESLSDVFGMMIKQRIKNQTAADSDWLIGENVLLGNNYALRSMKAPGTAYVNHPDLGTDPQPATMDEFVNLPDTRRGDNGGVHYNSGITNYAFYVTAYEIGGFSWEKAGKIWYEAATDKKLTSTATFSKFKALTIEKAELLYGVGSKESNAVKKGWNAAKV